jgi:hypothetical protein
MNDVMKKVLLFATILVSAQLYAQTSKTMNKQGGQQAKKKQPVYLAKTDSLFIAVKNRVITDLQTSAKRTDTASAENKIRAEEMKSWDEEKQAKYYRLFQTSVYDYLEKVDLGFDTFMLLFPDFGRYEARVLAAYDFRVRHIGTNQYAAEFWEDGLEANSEANALVWAHKILERYPEDSTGTINTVKETYARARKAIISGKQPRYTKVMALLYTKESNGMLFNDPFQALIDFR